MEVSAVDPIASMMAVGNPKLTSDDVDTTCARLVHASPHLVELCNIDFNP